MDIDLNTDAGGHGWGAVIAVPPDCTVAESTLLNVVAKHLLPKMTV